MAIFDINKASGEQVAAEFCSRELDVKFFPVDVSDREACLEAVKQFSETNNGCLHNLVNCAAYFGSKSLTASQDDWEKSFRVNVVGYSNMAQACYEYMKRTPGEKSVVNIASCSGELSHSLAASFPGQSKCLGMRPCIVVCVLCCCQGECIEQNNRP